MTSKRFQSLTRVTRETWRSRRWVPPHGSSHRMYPPRTPRRAKVQTWPPRAATSAWSVGYLGPRAEMTIMRGHMLGVFLPCFSQQKRRFKMVASHGSGIPFFHPECRFGHPESAPQSKPRPELCNDSWPVGHPKRTSRGRAQNLPGSAYRSHLED